MSVRSSARELYFAYRRRYSISTSLVLACPLGVGTAVCYAAGRAAALVLAWT